MQNSADDTSWWDELINGWTQKKVPPPPAPQPPPVNQAAWEKSVEQAKISDSLGSVHDLGLIVFNETQSYSDRADSNEPLGTARGKMAHSIEDCACQDRLATAQQDLDDERAKVSALMDRARCCR